MAEENSKCSVCGADLEGSDIYEKLCRKCREDQVLGRPPSARKPPRRAAPPVLRPVSPPPLKPGAASEPGVIAIEIDVDTDADTREMLVLKEASAEPSVPEAPAAPRGSAVAPVDFVELRQAAPETVRLEDDAAPATRQAEPAPRPAEGPSPPAAPDAKPPQAELPSPEPRLAPEPPVLKLRPQGRDPEFVDTEARILAPAAPTLRVSHALGPQASPPAARPARPAEGPSALSLADPGKVRLATDAPSQSHDRADSIEFRALLERLTHDVEEVSARLRGSAGLSMTPRQQMGLGFRAFFGFLLGASLFALAGIGILGLAGLLFYPPALAFLKRLLSSILGTP